MSRLSNSNFLIGASSGTSPFEKLRHGYSYLEFSSTILMNSTKKVHKEKKS